MTNFCEDSMNEQRHYSRYLERVYIISHLHNDARAIHLHRVAAMQLYFNISIHVRRKFQKATAIRLNEQSL